MISDDGFEKRSASLGVYEDEQGYVARLQYGLTQDSPCCFRLTITSQN